MISEKPVHKLLLFIGFIISKVAGEAGKACSISLLDGACPETETCVITESQPTGVCVCFPGYVRTADICVKAEDNGGDTADEGHALAWTFSILILIAIVIVGVYFIYKLRVVEWLKCKLSQRYNRSYDDVMIGQDDE